MSNETTVTETKKHRWKNRLIYKVLAVFLGLSLASLAIVGLKMISTSQKYIKEETLRSHISVAARLVDGVQAFIDNTTNLLVVVHKGGEFISMDIDKQKESLQNLMNAYPVFVDISYYTMEGNRRIFISRFVEEQPRLQPSEFGRIKEGIKSQAAYISRVRRSKLGYPLVRVAVPVQYEFEKPIGFLVSDINLIGLSAILKGIRIGETGHAYIIDSGQRMIAHSDFRQVTENNIPPTLASFLSHPMDRSGPGGREYLGAQKGFLGSYAPVKQLDWIVLVQQPLEEAHKVSERMKEEILLFMMIGGTLTILIGIYFTTGLVRPIRQLQSAMEKVGEGHFVTQLSIRTRDEIGQLADKFLWMTHALKDKSEQLLHAHQKLENWNKELERRVDERTRELREAQGELIKKERLAAIGQLSSIISHELKNPLGVVSNSIFILKTRLLPNIKDEIVRKYLEVIDSSIKSANQIIAEVLGFARQRDLILELNSLNELLAEIIMVTPKDKSIKIVKDLDPNIPRFLFDKEEMRQVFTNVINNAVHAMDGGGELSIRTRFHPEQKAKIVFSDTGCGIPAENLDKIFDPFFTTKSRGTGLGMAVVKKYVEHHMGSIDIKTQVGKGTTFVIRLPLDLKPDPGKDVSPYVQREVV